MSRFVKIFAPSRLHFGMLSFGRPDVRQFGGVGAMIDQPGLQLSVEPADTLEVEGPLAERALKFARRAAVVRNNSQQPRCRLTITAAPPQHTGLGVGTQLGMSVAAGINAYLGRPPLTAERAAQCSGRGLRSAVGSYGFFLGGLIIEAGKRDDDLIAPLVARIELPTRWRFALITPNGKQPQTVGLSGSEERLAFRDLPAVPAETTGELCRIAMLEMAPAARHGRFDDFSTALYRYGVLAGSCFQSRQPGPFASRQLAELVGLLRDLGVEGVGQSSWGPTLYALLPDAEHAEQFRRQLGARIERGEMNVTIAAPCNEPAKIDITQERPADLAAR